MPITSIGHEDDAFEITNQDQVVGIAPSLLECVDRKLDCDHACDDIPVFHRRGKEIPAFAGSCAKRKELPEASLQRLGEIGAVGETSSDKRAFLEVAAGRQRQTGPVHQINVRSLEPVRRQAKILVHFGNQRSVTRRL